MLPFSCPAVKRRILYCGGIGRCDRRTKLASRPSMPSPSSMRMPVGVVSLTLVSSLSLRQGVRNEAALVSFHFMHNFRKQKKKKKSVRRRFSGMCCSVVGNQSSSFISAPRCRRSTSAYRNTVPGQFPLHSPSPGTTDRRSSYRIKQCPRRLASSSTD